MAILLMFLQAIFTEGVLDIPSYPESTIGPTIVGPEEKFQSKASQMHRKCYFETDYCQQ